MSISDAARRRPFLRLNVFDFFGSDEVEALTPEQQGRYLRSLLKSWMTDTPGVAEPAQWGRWMGYNPIEWQGLAPLFAPCFKLDLEEYMWVQARLVEEWRNATRRSRQAFDAAAMRWHSDRNADASHSHEVSMREGRGERGEEASSEASSVLGLSYQQGNARASARAHAREGGPGGGEGNGEGDAGDLGREELGEGAGPASLAGAGGADGQGGGPAGAGGGDADVADDPAGAPPRGGRRGRAGHNGAADAARARRDEWRDAFGLFYDAYPRKVGPKEALAAWMKITPQTQETFDLIDMGLVRHIEAWKFREKDKIPHPATWLNKRRWEGEA